MKPGPFQNKPTPPTAPREPSRMLLSAVTRGKLDKPARILLYGVEGIGKSTFAANAPAPIFLAAEDGTAELDVARFPEPRTWQDVLDAVAVLSEQEHSYKTLVVDTLDWLEPLCWKHCCERDREQSIESYGYGKGYNAALDEWRVLLAAIERLCNKRGMGVVLLAHSWIKTFKDPESEGWDRYEMKLNAKAGGLIREWCDAQLFAQYETFTSKDQRTKRIRGVASGNRVLRTQRTAAYDAKNRYHLPDPMPLDYAAFAEARRQLPSPEVSLERIAALLPQVDADTRAKAEKAVSEANGDAVTLARYAETLSARVNIKSQRQEETEGQGAQ